MEELVSEGASCNPGSGMFEWRFRYCFARFFSKAAFDLAVACQAVNV
jgi:hypothetical protein